MPQILQLKRNASTQSKEILIPTNWRAYHHFSNWSCTTLKAQSKDGFQQAVKIALIHTNQSSLFK